MMSGNDKSDEVESAKTLLSDEPVSAVPKDPITANDPARLTIHGEASTGVPDAGEVLLGRYELEKELGRGGIGHRPIDNHVVMGL